MPLPRGAVERDDGTFTVPEHDCPEEQVVKMLDRSPSNKYLHRWISVGQGKVAAVRINWITAFLAIFITWGGALWCFAGSKSDQVYVAKQFENGKLWVCQNFTWLYIVTQDVWCAFLIYIMFSRFGDLRLGRDNESPRYNDFTWFTMLFTCGVAVGLYVFGVSEPLYFYRQPVKWHSWSFDYALVKTGTENDAHLAQQAIFMAIYHWGIHGWVPYILLALLAGITSFRWGLPMTIRSCFFPIIGDHALGLVGDMIDALSISTTTFGVCTSLGLGVRQLVSGLQFLVNFGCDDQDECERAGGTWDITQYGPDNCFSPTSIPKSCAATWLKNSDTKKDAQFVLIVLITLVATLSVLSGLNNGIKALSKVAFFLGFTVLLVCLMADNTWYLLSVMVQTTGYYLTYVMQVGFDCEAFQRLRRRLGVKLPLLLSCNTGLPVLLLS
jgi:choline-glycine betaine transporter